MLNSTSNAERLMLNAAHLLAASRWCSGKETRPVLRRVKHSDHHDRLLEGLVKDQIVTKLRHAEPADLRVARSGVENAPPKLRVPGKEVGCVEYGLPDTFGGIRIIGGDVTAVLVQITPGLWTQPGLDHDRRRNSSVVLVWSRFSSPSSSNRSSSGVITTSIP